jgi:hypothetical protein
MGVLIAPLHFAQVADAALVTHSLADLLGEYYRSSKLVAIRDDKHIATIDLHTLKTHDMSEFTQSQNALLMPHESSIGIFRRASR